MLLLLLFWTRLAAAQQDRHSSSTGTGPVLSGERVGPCFEEDAVAALREALQPDGALSNSSLALFGACTAPERSSGSAFSLLSEELRRPGGGLDVLRPAAVSAAQEQGGVTLTFDPPSSPLLELKPVLLLAFGRPPALGGLEVTFSSRSLQPQTQSACFSEGTVFVLLVGGASGGSPLRWRLSAESKSTELNQNLVDALVGESPGGPVGVAPLLLFPAGTSNSRLPPSGSSSSAVHTSFLCELRRFLEGVEPRRHSRPPLLRLDSVQSLPPLPLGRSSSEVLLAALINSSAPTVFYFNNWSSGSQDRRGALRLSPALWAELQLRLEQNQMLILDLAEEDGVSPRTRARLERLKDLSASQQTEAAEHHFCSFLLLKALQTVAQAHDLRRRLRSARAGPEGSPADGACRLRSLTVSFEKLFLSPQSANINNCRGACSFPLTNGNNHAVLLTSHAESAAGERAPCCVPVAYDPLEVVDWNDEGSFLSIKPDMIARECGCR
ncbi:muellerian-inhibiting factor isoform X1 [Oryzias melastigma]|uniref:muellerian-inhibiting factor isoform X1 n=1 Tax=Oryzias melastigma TaxID=30732 RepID=UPI000CF813FA|nr:muellerian-inhibiting factor isoform X1 [Oryzias melastigma]